MTANSRHKYERFTNIYRLYIFYIMIWLYNHEYYWKFSNYKIIISIVENIQMFFKWDKNIIWNKTFLQIIPIDKLELHVWCSGLSCHIAAAMNVMGSIPKWDNTL